MHSKSTPDALSEAQSDEDRPFRIVRILHVDTGRLWRGGQAQVFYLARGLRDLGHENAVLCPSQSPLAARCRSEGILVEPCEGRGDLSPSLARGVWGCVGEFRPDILHVHTAHAFAPLLVGRLRRVPGCVVSRRVSFPIRGSLSLWKYKRLPRKIIAVSGAIRDVLHRYGLPYELIHVIHSGYDPDRFLDLPSRDSARRELGWPPEARIILFVGALAPHKSIPTLLGAFQQVLGDAPHMKLRLVLAGDGPLRARVEEEIARRHLSPFVDLLGFREDVPRLMAAADAVVLASVEGEGSPAVIKEAMACGRAVVAASHGGVDEILEDGVSGLLVAPGSVSAFAEALMRILLDETLRAGLEEGARRAVTRFDVRHMVEETEQLYRKLIGSS